MESNNQAEALLSQLLAGGAKQTSIAALSKAYVAAWAEVGAGVKKNANNPHFGNDYADLSACVDLIKPVLAKHGLAILQAPGKMDGDKIEVFSLLLHESGESVSFTTQLPIGAKATAQAAGSAITYARRYALLAIFGLAPVDDDGEAASAPAPVKKAKKDAEPSYADAAEALVKDIEAFTGSVDELEKTIRPRVEELADDKVNKVYIARRRALKGAKA